VESKRQYVTKLSEKIKTDGNWRLEGDPNRIWKEMAECIRRSAKEVIEVARKRSGRTKGAWW